MNPPFFLRLLEISIGLYCTVGIEVAERNDQHEIEHAVNNTCAVKHIFVPSVCCAHIRQM
jgi:hypothetical protein